MKDVEMNGKISRRTLLAAGAASVAMAASPAGSQEMGKLHDVRIRNYTFIPDMLEVRVGDTIRWTNVDSVLHDASALDMSWNSKLLRHNESSEVKVFQGMSPDYLCSIHPGMRASIKVIPA
jgi:plastocyanin